jgi:hypothetical protein
VPFSSCGRDSGIGARFAILIGCMKIIPPSFSINNNFWIIFLDHPVRKFDVAANVAACSSEASGYVVCFF